MPNLSRMLKSRKKRQSWREQLGIMASWAAMQKKASAMLEKMDGR